MGLAPNSPTRSMRRSLTKKRSIRKPEALCRSGRDRRSAVFILQTIGLYTLGDDDQSSLERLRDIAVIYIVMISLILSILLAATTAALIYLVMQIKDRGHPAPRGDSIRR